jgi:tetratricopeptide (TPR) repeat protein
VSPDRWQRVKEIFSTASAVLDPERSTYLEEQCGDDTELRAEVESLLRAHEQPDAILDRPAAAYVSGDSTHVEADRWLGRRIGAYQLVALIGRGGMGEVYRARRVDAQYDKEVAIKLVPSGFHAGFVLQRLRAERQILANLEHPNIARLIDGGATEEGLPYLVMELVEGESLDRYCDHLRLPVRERLELFLEVCAAVSYAHQRLVVHRDLKPNNILVTAQGAVKLLDFGIAKLVQAGANETGAAATVTVLHALTPGFSSPEQILGKPITTASDVYSLGVVLYHLLARRSPYQTPLDSTEDALREVCQNEPPRPSMVLADGNARGARLHRDLDAITLRALRKEPEKRYHSVDEFSADVRRYLDGLPVIARGNQFAYRAGKFVRRRKLEIAAAALVGLALVGGTVASVRQARIADAQRLAAEQQRERAERHFASVRKLADVFMFEMHDAISNLPGSTSARQLLVNTALEYLDTLAKEAGQDRSLQQDLAAAYEKVADIQGSVHAANVGQSRAAEESYGRAIALLEPIAAADPANTRARMSLARSYIEQGELLLLRGASAQAIAVSRKGIAIFEALANAKPDAATRRKLAEAYATYSYTVDYGGLNEEAIAYGRKAIQILEELTRQDPADRELQFALGKAYDHFATALNGEEPDDRIMEEALSFHRKALAVDERLAATAQERNVRHERSLFVDHANIAVLLLAKQDYRGALEHALAARTTLARLGGDTSNAQFRVDEANLDWHVARARLGLGQLAEASAILKRNRNALTEIVRQDDTLKVQFLLGATEETLAQISVRHAAAAGADRVTRLQHWKHARALYESAVSHLARVTAGVKLDYIDQRTVDAAREGLARCVSEIVKLETAST